MICIRSRVCSPGHGGSLSWSWKKAALTLEKGHPGPGEKPFRTRNEDDLGPTVGSPGFVREQIRAMSRNLRLIAWARGTGP
jgi:hypothetical protein